MNRALIVLLATGWIGCVIGPKPEDPALNPDSDLVADTAVGGGGDAPRGDTGALDAPFTTIDGADAAEDASGDAAEAGDAPADAVEVATDGTMEGG